MNHGMMLFTLVCSVKPLIGMNSEKKELDVSNTLFGRNDNLDP